MRNLTDLQKHRRLDWELLIAGQMGDSQNGCFTITFAGTKLHCVAGSGLGWDHVSVSTAERCPTWEEMSHVYSLFAEPGETWMQLHVPPEKHINCHPFCLHLWRPHLGSIPTPPDLMVGPKR
jgi:hypothetical protein